MADRLRGRYEPLEVVGRGGQGEVVKALDHLHDRVVAIKIRRSTPERQEALLEEARTLLNLEPHRGLPTVRDDFFENDRYYMVMDWIEGTNLQHVLEQRGDPGLPYSTVLSYLSPVAEALDHLHAQEPPVVHQDVKPANLILTGRGRVVLVDLGIASSGRAATGLGTRGYIAPELASGEGPMPAVDIFSLAATAYALLTGAPPRGDPPVWEDVPEDRIQIVERALGRALSADPQRRPGSAGELLERLRTRLESQPAGGEQITIVDTPSSVPSVAARRLQIRKPLIGLMSLIATGAVLFILLQGGDGPLSSVPADSVAVIRAETGEVRAALELGAPPRALAVGDGVVWVISLDARTLARLDPESKAVGPVVATQGGPTGIAVDVSGSVWVLNGFEGTVVRFDPDPLRIEDDVDVGVGAGDVAAGVGGVWVTNEVDRSLLRIDPESIGPPERVLDGDALGGVPRGVAVGGGWVWVTVDRTLLKVDPSDGAVLDGSTLRFEGHRVTFGEGFVWVVHEADDAVSRVDPDTLQAIAIPVGDLPLDVAAGAGAAWVAIGEDRAVSRIDPSSGEAQTIKLRARPEGVAVRGTTVYVAVR